MQLFSPELTRATHSQLRCPLSGVSGARHAQCRISGNGGSGRKEKGIKINKHDKTKLVGLIVDCF